MMPGFHVFGEKRNLIIKNGLSGLCICILSDYAFKDESSAEECLSAVSE